MANAVTRLEPISSAPVTISGVTLQLAPPAARYSLRARDAALLADVTRLVLPESIGETIDGVAKVGPDEWYARLYDGAIVSLGDGQPISVTDIGDRAVGIIVEGPRTIETLSAGCPLDLSRFAIGHTTRTVFETVEIIVTREAELRFHVDVWRSFAPWLWQALFTAAAE